jgi:hypothetical protein
MYQTPRYFSAKDYDMSELNQKCTGSSKVTVSNNDKMSTCENFESFRDLNNPENGICILGEFSGIHRGLCWCDLLNIDVRKEVPLSCIICLLDLQHDYNHYFSKHIDKINNKKFDDNLEVTFSSSDQTCKTITEGHPFI